MKNFLLLLLLLSLSVFAGPPCSMQVLPTIGTPINAMTYVVNGYVEATWDGSHPLTIPEPGGYLKAYYNCNAAGSLLFVFSCGTNAPVYIYRALPGDTDFTQYYCTWDCTNCTWSVESTWSEACGTQQ